VRFAEVQIGNRRYTTLYTNEDGRLGKHSNFCPDTDTLMAYSFTHRDYYIILLRYCRPVRPTFSQPTNLLTVRHVCYRALSLVRPVHVSEFHSPLAPVAIRPPEGAVPNLTSFIHLKDFIRDNEIPLGTGWVVTRRLPTQRGLVCHLNIPQKIVWPNLPALRVLCTILGKCCPYWFSRLMVVRR